MRFGRLTVISRDSNYLSPKGYRAVNWLCKCDCGKMVVVRGCNLKSGASKSCGCNRIDFPNRTVHGLSKTKIYNIWRSMRARCENVHSSAYPDYGGRGINICDEWKNSFESFYQWSITHNYSDGLSIDRVDNNSGYFPDNCRWVDAEVQQNNKRNNHYITYDGQTMTMKQWADKTGIKYQKLKDRINKCGWDVARALTTK